MQVSTRYARSGDLHIAYQVFGEGKLDIVFVPPFVAAMDGLWGIPDVGRLFRRMASFSRLILFDRRGSGMSDREQSLVALEDQVDDVRAVLDAVGAQDPVLLSALEGSALSALFAASHPDEVRALVMMGPVPRVVQGPDYEWAQTLEERAALVDAYSDYWGSDEPQNPFTRFGGEDEQTRLALARIQRLSISPGAARAALKMIGEVDVRHVLPNVQCPTLVMRRAGDVFFDERHSRYVAEHVPGARYVELPGAGVVWLGDVDGAVDEIEQFLTGMRRPLVSDRVLATVLFTDIVGSTERAARLGDGGWRALLERHDALVRSEVERHRGRFVKSLGDGALAVFDGPSRAIDSALAIRDGARGLDLEIRAGLHTGECELLPDDDLGGLAVHIGARVGGIAAPGEVLVSSTVRDLIVGSGQTLTDRGEHDLRGVPGPWRMFAVETPAA